MQIAGVHASGQVLAAPLRREAPVRDADADGPTRRTDVVRVEREAASPATSAADPASFERLFASGGPGWAAADGTISVPLRDGRTMWLFGDTVLRRDGDGPTMVRNSAVLQRGSHLTTLTSGSRARPGAFVQPDAAGQWYWPAGGVDQGSSIALFMGRVRETGSGAPGWNFTGAGSDLVLLDPRTLEVRSSQRLPGGDGMVWGAATVERDGFTYVYGFRQGDQPLDRTAHVARVASGKLGTDALEFWDGRAWTRDATASKPVADGVSNQFSVVRLPSGRFAMLSQELMLGNALTARTSDSPVGPWSEPRVVDPGPELPEGVFSYNAMAHPSFTSDGQLLVGWNRNRDGVLASTEEQYRDYRAAFRAVPLDAIDR